MSKYSLDYQLAKREVIAENEAQKLQSEMDAFLYGIDPMKTPSSAYAVEIPKPKAPTEDQAQAELEAFLGYSLD